MGNHLIKSRIGIFRLLDTYDLHLVELVEAVESADILAIRTCLPTEAWSICSHLNRKIIVAENHIPVDVRNRNLSCRYEIEVIGCSVVHLAFLVRKLACSEA